MHCCTPRGYYKVNGLSTLPESYYYHNIAEVRLCRVGNHVSDVGNVLEGTTIFLYV